MPVPEWTGRTCIEDWLGQTCNEKCSISSASPAGLGSLWPGGTTLNPAAVTPWLPQIAPASPTPRTTCEVAPGASVTVFGVPWRDAGLPICSPPVPTAHTLAQPSSVQV